jgi:regulatory protein
MKRDASTYDRALHLLGFRARSVAEMRRRLIQAGAPRTEVEEVVTRLIDQKLLDDADFAQQFARTKVAGGASRLRVLQELRRKGVAADVAEGALDTLLEEEGIDPSRSARAAAEKKWRSLARVDDSTRKRRVYAFLARRGFSPDEIRSAMNALGAEVE